MKALSNVRIELDHRAIENLLKSEAVADMCFEAASEIAERAGDGYEADKKTLSTRVVASAYTADMESMRDQYEHNTLLKAMRG